MSDNNEPNSIGNPEPVDSGRDWGIFDPIPNIVALVGGILACAFLVTPARARGASHSAKLKWQQRQAEIERVIAAELTTDEARGSAASPSE